MVLEKQTIQLGKGILLDVDPKSEYVNIRCGKDDKGELVKKVDLWAVVFTIADAATQEKLMPVRQIQQVTYRRVHHIKLKRDMRAGETVNAKCEINVDQNIHEGLAGSLLKKIKLEVAVNDEFVKPTIDAIVAGGKTGAVGDGKIFVQELKECIRIRTGERGGQAI